MRGEGESPGMYKQLLNNESVFGWGTWRASIVTQGALEDTGKNKLFPTEIINPHDVFKSSDKLSLASGKFVLFENIDQYPLLISNFGMASKLMKYYYIDSPKNAMSSHIGTHGIPSIIDNLHKFPLIAKVNKLNYKGCAILRNNVSPIYIYIYIL